MQESHICSPGGSSDKCEWSSSEMTKLTPVKTTINFLHCYIQDDKEFFTNIPPSWYLSDL